MPCFRVYTITNFLGPGKEGKDECKGRFRPSPAVKADKAKAYLCQRRRNPPYRAKTTLAASVFEEEGERIVLKAAGNPL